MGTVILQVGVENFAGRHPFAGKYLLMGAGGQAGASSTIAGILGSVSSTRKRFWKWCLCPRNSSYLLGAQCSSNWPLMHAGKIPLKLLLGVDLSVSLKMLVNSLICSVNILVWLVINMIRLEIVNLCEMSSSRPLTRRIAQVFCCEHRQTVEWGSVQSTHREVCRKLLHKALSNQYRPCWEWAEPDDLLRYLPTHRMLWFYETQWLGPVSVCQCCPPTTTLGELKILE